MYGTYTIPAHLEARGLSISIDRRDTALVYRRTQEDQAAEKLLLCSDKGSIVVNPVEPLNLPRDLTPYLYLDFHRPVALGARVSRTVFATFPIEIGVFLQEQGEIETLDIVSFARQKYTLYGDPGNGILCRYWSTPVDTRPPSPDPLREGVLELKLINTTASWIEVRKAIFSAYGMKLFYSDSLVGMRAEMEVTGPAAAQTDIRDSFPGHDMRKSLELYTARKLVVLFPKFSMSEGI
jgi:hypothetical protein